MTSNQILFGLDALLEVKKGVDILADAVKTTFGPKGNTVIIYEDGLPKVTKDGVTVARAINSSTPLQDIGIQLVKEAASKTADSAGDGTTTSTIIAQSLIHNIYQQLAADRDPKDIRNELEESLIIAKNIIKESALQVRESPKSIESIATISANGDSQVGSLIADIIEKIGYDGVISLEESNGFNTYSEVIEGMKFTKGYISPYFVNDALNRSSVLKKPYIFLYNGTLNNVKALFTLLELIASNNEEILIIANDYSPEVINAILRNVNRGVLRVCAIRSPGVGEYKKDLLEDISVITGATVYTKFPLETRGIPTTSLSSLGLGKARKVVVSSEETSIIGGEGTKEAIASRISLLKESLNKDYPKYLQDDIRSRIAKLSGGVAIVYVGAPTEVEMSEKKDRIEDAICATRAAIEEGVVVGAGHIQSKIASELFKRNLVILGRALQSCRDLLLESINQSYEEAKSLNILDPAKVTRVSIENALSVAYMFLSTKCIVINQKNESDRSLY